MSAPRRLVGVALLAAVCAGVLVAVRTCEDVTSEVGDQGPAAGSSVAGAGDGVPEPVTPLRGGRAAVAVPSVPDTAPPAEQSSAVETALSIEVVDESGAQVAEASVRLVLADIAQYAAPGVSSVLPATVREHPFRAGAPVILRGLPEEAAGIRLRAFGAVQGVPPLAPVDVELRASRIERVRLVAAAARNADVLVLDAATDLPVRGARVVSATERDRRDALDLDDPEPAVTGADGRCTLVGIGSGEHEVEVDAEGYRRSEGMWTAGELRIRLEPREGDCTVNVRVVGPDGVPVPDVRIELVRTDRVMKTDAGGRVTFAGVAPGVTMVQLDMSDWRRVAEAGKWAVAEPRLMTFVMSEAGETYEFVLGVVPRGTGSIAGRVVDENGAPIAGARVGVFDVGNARAEAVSDAAGDVRFAELPLGEYGVSISRRPEWNWYMDDIALAEGEEARATWTLGSITVRGRVVGGPERRGVAEVDVWLRGAVSGVATSGPDGRFEVRRARPGTYTVDAKSGTSAAVARAVTIPVEGDLVVELVEYGRVVLRFHADDRDRLRDAKFSLFEAGAAERHSGFDPGTGDDERVADEVLPGRYEIEVVLSDRSRRIPVEVTSGKASVVEVENRDAPR